MALLATHDLDITESNDEHDALVTEGKKSLTIPLKECHYKSKEIDKDDEELQGFITRYKLHKLSRLMFREGITIEFLLSQSTSQIEEIAKELTSKTIQRNKFVFAVDELRKKNNLLIQNANQKEESPKAALCKIAIDKHTETIKSKFGSNTIIVTWHYNDTNNQKHEIVFKYDTKTNKNGKSKRRIFFDGNKIYSKKSNDVNFVIEESSDDLRVQMMKTDDESCLFFELFINNVSFTHLMEPPMKDSISL